MDRDGSVDRVRVFLIALAAAATGILTAAALTYGVALVVAGVGLDLGIIESVVVTLALTAGVAFGGVSLAYLRYRGLEPTFIGVRFPTARDLGWVGGGYLLALLAVIAGSTLVGLLGAEAAPNELARIGIEHPALLLLLVPVSLFLVAPGEELLFRGVVQGTLREAFGPVGAVGIASAIFAGVHYLALSGGTGARLTTIALLFLPSLVFGAAYERTDNLVVPILIHGLYNSTLVVLLYVALRFVGEPPVAGLPA